MSGFLREAAALGNTRMSCPSTGKVASNFFIDRRNVMGQWSVVQTERMTLHILHHLWEFVQQLTLYLAVSQLGAGWPLCIWGVRLI
ncbi:hypothetical protein [Phormidesmis priestleyi]